MYCACNNLKWFQNAVSLIDLIQNKNGSESEREYVENNMNRIHFHKIEGAEAQFEDF